MVDFDQTGALLGCLDYGGCVMSCVLCASVSEAEFTAEMMIHFSGLKHLANPGVLAFPKLLVCLDCGSSRFTIAERERALLAGDTPTIKASTLRSVLPSRELSRK